MTGIIPVKCFTCGCVLGDKYRWYIREVKQKNIFLTEDKKSYLTKLAKKLKSEIIHHNNFIGGRYSVLSEVGMLPAALMGLNVDKFRRLNFLVKKKNFINSLIQNVKHFIFYKKKKI